MPLTPALPAPPAPAAAVGAPAAASTREPVPGPDRVLVRLSDVEQAIARWKRRWPDLVHASVLGTTREGRPIRLLRIGPGATPGPNLPETLLLAGIHPREQQPTLCLLRFVEELLEARQRHDIDDGDLLDRQVLWVVPAFNPDGKAWEERHPDWRKNRAPLGNGVFGVDLNRNFQVRWGGARQLDPLWRTTTDTPSADIHEGPAPLSEPETKALVDFWNQRPKLRAFLDIHSPLREILSPAYVPAGDGLRFARLIEGMRAAQATPYAGPNHRFEQTPPLGERTGNSGLTYHHAYYTRGIFGLNYEFSNPSKDQGVAGRYPSLADADREYAANARGAWKWFLRIAPTLPATLPGRVAPLGPESIRPAPAPGTVVRWTPPLFDGAVDWAVLTSPSPQVQILSEVRYAPFTIPFTVRIAPDAKPGARVPLVLHLWDRGRRHTERTFELTVGTP